MSENPLLSLMFSANDFVGGSEKVEGNVQPVDDQLNFGPGDAALQAASSTLLERDFAVLRGIDPAKHAEEFPDWEERLLMGYVLVEHFSRSDPEISIGWVSRLKLLPMSSYRYRQARKWMTDGFPDVIPDWASKNYQKYADQLALVAPDTVPKPCTCGNCGSREILFQIIKHTEYQGRAGEIMRNGENLTYVPVTDLDEQTSAQARLICTDCESVADLDKDEWDMPD